MNGNPVTQEQAGPPVAPAAPAGADAQQPGTLPIVQTGEALEEWLARAVPPLMQMEGLDEATATDLATQAWNQVNGGDQAVPADAPAPADSAQADPVPPDQALSMQAPDVSEPDDSEDDDADIRRWLENIDFGDDGADKQSSNGNDPAADPGQATMNGDNPDDAGDGEDAGGVQWDDESTWMIDDSDPLARWAGEDDGKDEQMAMDAPVPDPTGMDATPDGAMPEAAVASWFTDQLSEFARTLTQALVDNGNLTPEQAQALVLQATAAQAAKKSFVMAGRSIKATTLAAFLEAEIHRNFTILADGMRQNGNLTRDERIALSGCIGDALTAFLEKMQIELGDAVMGRPPFSDLALHDEGFAPKAPDPAMPDPAMPEQLQQVAPGRYSYSFALPSSLPAKTLPVSLINDLQAVKLFNDGFSYSGDDWKNTGKFAVFPYPTRSVRVYSKDGLSDSDVAEFISANADVWNGESPVKIAVWTDDEHDNRFTLDVVCLLDTVADAVKTAASHDAKYYLDLENKRLIPIPGKLGRPAEQVAKLNVKATSTSGDFDLDALRSVWVATKGFVGPQFSRKRYRALDSVAQNAVKMSANRDDRVEGYLILWGDPQHTDLAGEYFTPQTEEIDTIFKAMGGIPAFYHHAFDNVVKSMVVGVIDTMERDDVGVWVEAKIREAQEYQKFIRPLVEKETLGWSSGTLPLARRTEKSGRIARWPAVEGSMTHTPAEWRMVSKWPVQQLKSAFVQAGFDPSKLVKAIPADTVDDMAVQLELERLNLLSV